MVPRSSSTDLAEAIEVVEKLKRIDQKALYDLLAMKLQESGGKTRDVDMWALAVHEALVAAIGTGGAGMPGPMITKRCVAATSSWSYVDEFVEWAQLDSLKVAERQSVYHMLARLLVRHANETSRHVGAPLTPKFVADQTRNLAAIVESALPGYAGAGMLLLVARKLTEGGLEKSL